jgi:hypothetical protein
VDGDDVVIGQYEVNLIRGDTGGVGPRAGAMHHHVHESVEVLDLRALAELLGVVEGQSVDVEDVGQQVVRLVIDPVQIEPEEHLVPQVLLDRLPGGVFRGAARGQDSLHDVILPLPGSSHGDGRQLVPEVSRSG